MRDGIVRPGFGFMKNFSLSIAAVAQRQKRGQYPALARMLPLAFSLRLAVDNP
jgi:hypothetical protein